MCVVLPVHLQHPHDRRTHAVLHQLRHHVVVARGQVAGGPAGEFGDFGGGSVGSEDSDHGGGGAGGGQAVLPFLAGGRR